MGASYLDGARLSRSIAAVATPPGRGAIGIVRLSGKDAVELAAQIFSRPHTLRGADSHTLHLGQVISLAGSTIDQVLAVIMRAPATYTGEDIVEFHTHGGPVQVGRVLQACLQAGALAALPGEFTFRAFFQGKIDLTQAESVADLIASGTDAAARSALEHTDGVLRSLLEQIRECLVQIRARCDATLDFVDDDIPEIEKPVMLRTIDQVDGMIAPLLESYAIGRLLRHGARVVLSGPPNVGKSSLFNALLRRERAIVTSIPGTTRDAVTEAVEIEGLPVILADTAGTRDSQEVVEQEGRRMGERFRASADLVLEVRDASLSDHRAPPVESNGNRSLLVWNKCDLVDQARIGELALAAPASVVTSARTGSGLDRLARSIAEHLVGQHLTSSQLTLSRKRHFDGLSACRAALARAKLGLESSAALEVVSLELRSACTSVDELVGRVFDEEVINRIFSDFCVGK
jgi:tRNA modification GTPase